jgi:ACS family glucarate transporter-like MFS transporter
MLIFGTFILTVFLYIDRACISAAKDDIILDLDITDTQFGWILAIFALGYSMFQTPGGYFADSKGPRLALSIVVTAYSILTFLTGTVKNYVSMLVVRFFFGAGEAGEFPGLSKVVFNWFPIKERGIVQGINFSGSRLGAAFALPLVAWLITKVGWRETFYIFGALGVLIGVLWYFIFRDHPDQAKSISQQEKDLILSHRQQPSSEKGSKLPFSTIIKSGNMWKAMFQYICSNFTFYFTLSWMYPYLQTKYQLGGVETGLYAMIPLIGGAFGNWFSGILVDAIYKNGNWKGSRRIPAIIGFALAALGIVMMPQVNTPILSVIFLSIAIFGADMTLSPSWSFCIDIGKEHAGAVSGTMNMAGNFLGAFVTMLAFPYLLKWTGSHNPFFYVCFGLSVLAIITWMSMKPDVPIAKKDNE